jgi:signal transduction histidine kinase
MFESASSATKTEMQVVDLRSDDEFMTRQIRPRGLATEISGIRRLADVFAQRSERILQELVEVSIDMCGADSAGLTLEETLSNGETQFRWIAAAGKYADFLDAVLPRFYSRCGTCLDRGQPQLFRVPKPYLDLIGVEAAPVTDGILVPWQVDDTRGTIWVLAHGAYQRFDREDYRMLRSLSDFAAIAVRNQRQQAILLTKTAATAAAAMGNDLAHQINNPLQKLMQTVYLVGQGGAKVDTFAQQAMDDLIKLSELVRQLLDLSREL